MSGISFTVSELADLLDAQPVRSSAVITGIATLQSAQSQQLGFLHNSRYRAQLASCKAGAVLVREADSPAVKTLALIVDDPYLAYARASALFASLGDNKPGICPTATISGSAKLADDVVIGSNVVVGDNTRIGSGVIIGPNTVVGPYCKIDKDTRLAANVTLYHGVRIGSGCMVHGGAVLGADGFGFANQSGKWVKIHQLGGVVIGDNVEIGAGTTIDRGALEDTVIANGVILDNQIQIAHNVEIGENTAIAGCTAIAGSSRIGKNCTIAGACGVTGHLEIADGTHVTAMSLVSKSITRPGIYSSGTVVEPHQQWKRNVVRFRQLDDLSRRVKELETQVKKNSEGQSE